MLVWLRLKFIIHNIFFFLRLTYNPGYLICQVIMSERIVYVIQEIPGTRYGRPRINILGAKEFGRLEFLLPEFSQIIFSPGPLIYELRKKLKNFKKEDYILCTGDPAIIGIACSLVSDITNGRYHLLKWDRQEAKYYPITINLYEKGKIDDN